MENQIERFGCMPDRPLISIVIVNYNGAGWLPKCLESIKTQTIFSRIETIVVDNHSTDDSLAAARRLLVDFPMAGIVQSGENLGFCEGNNVGARAASGKYVFFLNPDAWLEADCMEQLATETEKAAAAAATPWVLNYLDDTHQDLGFFGFDMFGLCSASAPRRETREIFSPTGCSYLINANVFKQVGMFDRRFFMYSEEVDLSWRVWIAGGRIIGVPRARAHHRGAVNANPTGGASVVEFRTTDQKRFLSNRNCLLTLLKNAQHVLLLAVVPLTLLLLVEGLAGSLLLRRWSFARAAFLDVMRDCWRLRGHVRQQRKMIAAFRQRSDFWMLRFFKLRLNRWDEVKRAFKFGLPHVDAR
jgi:GT2 family glycosyltransferase